MLFFCLENVSDMIYELQKQIYDQVFKRSIPRCSFCQTLGRNCYLGRATVRHPSFHQKGTWALKN